MLQSSAPQDAVHSSPNAGFVSRLLAILIDLLIVVAVITIVTFVSKFLRDTITLGSWTVTFLRLLTFGFAVIFVLAYDLLFVTVAGQTPGKRIMGLRIIATDGGPVTFGKGIRRLVGMVIALPLFWGYLMVVVDEERRAFQDHFAGTVVVYEWSLPPSSGLSHPLFDRMQAWRRKYAQDRKDETG